VNGGAELLLQMLSCPIQRLIGVLRDSTFNYGRVILHPSLTTLDSVARHP